MDLLLRFEPGGMLPVLAQRPFLSPLATSRRHFHLWRVLKLALFFPHSMFLDIVGKFVSLRAPYMINISHNARRDLRRRAQQIEKRGPMYTPSYAASGTVFLLPTLSLF